MKKQKDCCADRESNPGQMLGRHLCYHYTIGARARTVEELVIFKVYNVKIAHLHTIKTGPIRPEPSRQSILDTGRGPTGRTGFSGRFSMRTRNMS